MHSSLVRLQQVFGFLTTVSFALGALIALSVTIFPEHPTADVNISSISLRTGRQGVYSRLNEYALIKFDLDADLTDLFNWNTKQLFTYITVTYPGRNYIQNEAVIWDSIITTKEAANMTLKNQVSKYNIHDITGEFNERNATVSFSWNVQPHVGLLTWSKRGNKEFAFPPINAKKAKKSSV